VRPCNVEGSIQMVECDKLPVEQSS